MKTSVNLPEELVMWYKNYNTLHPDHPLSISGICRLAMEQKKVEIESEAKLH